MTHFERSRSVISWVLIITFSLSQIVSNSPNAYAAKPLSTLQEEEGEEYVEALAASLGEEEEGLPRVELHRRLGMVSVEPMATAASLGGGRRMKSWVGRLKRHVTMRQLLIIQCGRR